MANQNITFDIESGTPYESNLTINGGANFSNVFTVKKPNSEAFNFTDYSGSSQMTKSVAIGATDSPDATFSVGFPRSAYKASAASRKCSRRFLSSTIYCRRSKAYSGAAASSRTGVRTCSYPPI